MRVILSRKGLDSGFGGLPSPVLPDGRILTIPIPGDPDEIPYAAVQSGYEGKNLYELLSGLSAHVLYNGEKTAWSERTMCHLDPDLGACSYPRKPGWRGCFGQGGAAQTVLERAGVQAGDLFLFFGWFQRTQLRDGKLRFCPGQGFHMLYGYLQIEEVCYPQRSQEPIPDWLRYHPHVLPRRLDNPNNCIYLGARSASWNDALPGYGLFPTMEDALILTKPGMTRSRWRLPEDFRGLKLTYHAQSAWKDGYFQSACRGQEFVFEEDERVQAWAQGLIDLYAARAEYTS